MKALMQNFDRQTEQRFNEYEERMMKNRKKCKEQCYKDIQKIILKDKIEKELKKQLTTLETNIETNDIPTCICEKSVADKTEKLCLKCGYGIGSNVPLVGLINGVTFHASVLKYAVDIGTSEGARVAVSKGMEMATQLLKQRIPGLEDLLKSNLAGIVTKTTYNTPKDLVLALRGAVENACTPSIPDFVGPLPVTCDSPLVDLPNLYLTVPQVAVEASKAGKEAGVAAGKVAQGKAWSTAFTWETFLSSPLGISIIVTVCILVMLIIIYLILRYRRNKKMKKKLKYIKLLEE